MKDEWIDKLPQKMADWTPEVPEGVWESVEAAVPAVAGGRRWRPVIYLASAVSIAAAIVAAVATTPARAKSPDPRPLAKNLPRGAEAVAAAGEDN